MKLTQLLVRLGLVHGEAAAAPAPTAAPPPVFEKRVLKLEDLRVAAGEERARQQEEDLGLLTSPETIGLDEVIQDESAPSEVRLQAAGRRDDALDRYEAELVGRVGQFETEARREADRLRSEAQRLLAEAKQVEARVAEIHLKLEAWRARKRAEEAELEQLGQRLARPAG